MNYRNRNQRHDYEEDYRNRSIVEDHYRRREDDDPRRYRDTGRPNSPNYGRPVYAEGPDVRQDYGYNQGRNSTSNIGGRAYGQSYGQYFQGSDQRRHSNAREYQGEFEPYYANEDRFDYGPEDDFNDRFDDDRFGYYTQFREPGYQGGAGHEGFGMRQSRRYQGGWEDDDQYRAGHAQRRYGRGRYGSR